MKNKFVFVHRWDGDSESDFWPYLNEKLKTVGEVVNLNMPNSAAPEIGPWVEYLKNNVGLVDENVHFVGHSVGCQTIMRLLNLGFQPNLI
jgi:predicted alpha/beta hydrolase family esterase